MNKQNPEGIPPSPDTTAYPGGTDPYGIRERTEDVFAPPQFSDGSAYVPNQEVTEAQNETQKRIVRRKARRLRRQRAHEKQLRRRRHRLLTIGAVFCVFLIWLFLRLAPVPFGTLLIDGNDKMTFDTVYKACGIQNGIVNVIQLSPSAMRDRMEKDLRVADVDISREFPATIHIRMKERETVAIITTMYGFACVDATGTVIELAPQIKGHSAPLITGKKVDTLLLGDKIQDDAMRAALAYLENLSPELHQSMTEINVGNPESIIAYTSKSVPIHLGSGDNPAGRAAMTDELLQEVKRSGLSVQYIDTDPRTPLVKSN